jgi:adenosylhomocysteinase
MAVLVAQLLNRLVYGVLLFLMAAGLSRRVRKNRPPSEPRQGKRGRSLSRARQIRRDLQEYCLDGTRRVYVLGEGRLVNLAAAEGHPAQVMDMSFANQALAAEYVVQHHAELEHRVYGVPAAIDAEVARLKLAAFGINLDAMTPEQAEYVSSWKHGT